MNKIKDLPLARTPARGETEPHMETHPAERGNAMEGTEDLNQGVLLRLELTSNPSVLCAVRGAVDRLTESFGFSAAECRAVTRAVDEALTNIIRHAYHGESDQPIEVLFRSVQGRANPESGAGLEILLCDR